MARIAACLLIVVIVSGVLSAPAPQEDVQVLRYDNNNQGDGNYQYTYELSNGQIHSEAGGLSNGDGSEDPYTVVSGAYSYVGPDGVTYWVTYTADEDGFHPIVGQGPGGIQGGGSASLDPSVFKSLVG
ncbi:flexible cuticle protein 12-like [Bradysia coprophila]|uniref:flexible cuticle protein 12-like n=1 Tax=Bradysia coprophila TaxID=38358 RepID=UPI00187DC58B|nr:flexible cuticle protein 12-like [Bradysia coprophila]